jgi:HD domain
VDLDGYRPSCDWFLVDPRGVHGIAHAARVLVWANAIANSLRKAGQPLDLAVVRWAAVLHDTRRRRDRDDEAHGIRAAMWVRERGASGLAALSANQREAVAYCVQWHVPPDEHAPEMTAELTCLKDADSLDRVRFGMLDARYLRTPAARVLVPFAAALFRDSEQPGHPRNWADVRVAAERLDFWSKDAEVQEVCRDRRGYRCTTC